MTIDIMENKIKLTSYEIIQVLAYANGKYIHEIASNMFNI